MGLLKYAILGTAAVYGIKYLTKKRSADGKSLADDIKTKANKYLNEVSHFGERIRHDYRQTNDLY
jgi:hypothetical protein